MKRYNYYQIFFETIILLTLSTFIIPKLTTDKFLIIISIIMLIPLLRKRIIIPKYLIICIIILILSCCLGLLFSQYNCYTQFITTIVLLSIIIMAENYNISERAGKKIVDIPYIVFFSFIIYQISVGKLSQDGSIIFPSINDKNYSGIFVYLFFLYCNKKGKILGILFSICYSILFINSRSYLLLISLFYLISYFKYPVLKIMKESKNFYFKLMIRLFVFSVILSFFWTFVISTSNVVSHYDSLNDASNRIRFVSSVRSFLFLFEDIKTSMLWGYGSDYASTLGVDVTYSQLPVYYGTKILQAHNSYLNLMNVIGIIPIFVYLYGLGRVLNNIKMREYVQYIIPFLVNAMFVHSLLNERWLLLFILVLMIPEDMGILHNLMTKIKLSKFVRR